MAESGAEEIFCVGGVQALAGMAFGLEGSDPVDMIVGPGNAYVAEAKRQLFGKVGIDLLAGPTEIMIIADESADPSVVACDLLGQAEHGPTSPAILATTSEDLGRATIEQVDWWLERWPTADIAGAAWRDFGTVILCGDDAELVAVANAIAPEHLEIQTTDPDWFVGRLSNYGSLFIGTHATVAYSDKAIGTNHTLPTRKGCPVHRWSVGGEVSQDRHHPALQSRGFAAGRRAGGSRGGRRVDGRPRHQRSAPSQPRVLPGHPGGHRCLTLGSASSPAPARASGE